MATSLWGENKIDEDAVFQMMQQDGLDDDELMVSARDEIDFGTQVVVLVGPNRFVVSVGEGLQTIRWLTLVASQRYTALVQAKSKQRRTDTPQLQSGNLNPVECKLNGNKLEPNATIQSVLARRSKKESKEEPEFEVNLCASVSLTPDGAPHVAGWQASAFYHTDSAKDHAVVVQEKLKKLGLCPGEDETDQDTQGKYYAPGLHQAFAGPDEIAVAMNEDWKLVEMSEDYWTWFKNDEETGRDVVKESEVRASIASGLESINALMDNYSWCWYRAEPYSINGIELKHLLHYTGVIDLDHDAERLQRAISSTFGDSNAPIFFSRGHVIAIILHLAFSSATPADFSKEVSALLKHNIVPAAAALRVTDKATLVRRVLSRSSVTRLFRGKGPKEMELKQSLCDTFKMFCIRSVSQGSTELSMDFREFRLFLADTMQSNESKEEEKLPDASGADANSTHKGTTQTSEDLESEAYNKVRRYRAIFNRAQKLVQGQGKTSLGELVLSEFVMAILLALYDRESELDTWDSRHGAEQFLELVNSFERIDID
mmetsp:Transcript_4507/g.7938  ORF Transcript_4507/g.7938 Transcript_4507/m.7938 type:complete len:543 (+) Transcript_4507:1210-2838(+)|eukprot:CAMPEP_0184525672 /NCGR_PEP_ID=MMETSP0198_2-20121128/10235_1 /TAXON_ID=1112570 /ORGANISM="Thraustochytrium sp., Strain LLF1b" /LENGTH=542 /DNA_ID=CAMNT_0026917171 /DNA_START=1126 /DNA_END=2754 /DNA_ORIENTATION=+